MSDPDGNGTTEFHGGADGLRVCVLDVVSVTPADGEPRVIGSLQQKALLTLLVAGAPRSVSLDAIADELWPETRPRRWRGCIATLANSLRAAAADRDFVFSTARGYALHRRAGVVATDVDELQECMVAARSAECEGRFDVAETMARRALRVYGTGPWTTDYWGWNEAAAEAARVLATALLERRAAVSCISELSRRMEDFDWHDGVWACLISAHQQLGSMRRALELTQKAKAAVGGSTPTLARVEAQLSAGSKAEFPARSFASV